MGSAAAKIHEWLARLQLHCSSEALTATNQGVLMKICQMMTTVVLLTASALACAQAPDALQVRGWAASCANCHGTLGQALAPMQSLAGSPKEVIVQRMMDFKSGKVPSATIMHQLAKGYSDEQIVAIAAYFAAQKP